MIDPIRCWDLHSLQAMLFMIIYSQTSGDFSACHSYLSAATAAALRMGIHRSAGMQVFNHVERETQRRMIWALQTMDTYISTMLGLPKCLDGGCIDQEFPREVDDEDILLGGIQLSSPSGGARMKIVNAHTRLIMIVSTIVNSLFNHKDQNEKGYYRVNYSEVVGIENRLEAWFADLPTEVEFVGENASNQVRYGSPKAQPSIC